MIDDIFVITEGGQLLYSWHPEGRIEEKDDLITGFLTALNSFATFERGEDIKSLKLKETNIIFEKSDDAHQKLTFVITTKNEGMKELLHSVIHDVMTDFKNLFQDELSRDFDGEVTTYQKFEQSIDNILKAHGLDVFESSIKSIDNKEILKSVIFLEPKGGHIFYIHAKQYVNKDKASFLLPLLVTSGRLLYQSNLRENVRWILLNTTRNENMLVEIRDKLLIARQYELSENFEDEFLSLEFFKSNGKYVKNPKKKVKMFENMLWDPRIKQVFLVDLVGKILFSKLFDNTQDCSDYIPETISFLTSSKKASEEIFNRTLFNSTIGGEKLATICMNLNTCGLILIGSINDFSDFQVIQKISSDVFKQLL